MPLISRSARRKAVALLMAIAGFVLLYETRILDSRHAAWQAMLRESAPPAAGERLQFSATAYCKGSKTASGVAPRTGVAAADPALLPVGSVINVTTGDPTYNGVYTVMDTGPKVQGRILDLYMWSCHDALKFGRKQIDVVVLRLGWDPAASSPSLVDRLFRRREARRAVPPADPPPPASLPHGGDSDAAASGADPPAAPEAPVRSPEASVREESGEADRRRLETAGVND